MGTASRSTKTPSGGTSWVTGDQLNQTPVEEDFDNIYDVVNGGIDNDNIAAGANINASKLLAGSLTDTEVSATAAIAVSKLAQTAGQLDSDIVDDSADDEATFRTTSNPGESGGVTLPTNLEEEIQDMRYALLRQALGVNASLTDGTNGAGWYDGVALGRNLIRNGSLLDDNSTPDGWTIGGAPATQELLALPVAEGDGKYLHLADPAGATTDGPSWTLALKASTKYLISARVLDTTADVKLTTTGGTGTFGDLDLTGDAGAWQTLAGVVETDATPTDIVIQIDPSATNYDMGIAWVDVREISDDDLGKRGGNLVLQASSTSTTPGTVETALDLSVIPPAPGYTIVVRCIVQSDMTSENDTLTLDLNEDVDAGGASAVATSVVSSGGATAFTAPAMVEYIRADPTPGSVYRYTVTLTIGSGAATDGGFHSLTVELRAP